MNTKFTCDKFLLYDMYVTKKMSLSDIAAIYSVSSMTVRHWLNRSDIPTRPSTQDVYKELKISEFSHTQKSIIIGSVLGDGSITIGKDCKNARFTEKHSEKQKDYLLWKNNLLKPFVKSKIQITEPLKHIISGISCDVSKSFCLTTISHPYLTNVRNIFYNDLGKKIVPENLYSMMDGLVMTVWLCDDGCFTYDKSSGIYRLDLHTESFTYKENVFLCREILSKFFNMSFRINSRAYNSGKAYYICLSGELNLINLVDKIKKFIPECMKYKFEDYI